MADAQATFVATLDSSGIQSGARSTLSPLQRMGAEIQKRSKDLAALKAANDRLAKSAGVQEFMKRQKALEKNEAFQAKVEKRLADVMAKKEAAENLAIAKQANVAPEELKQIEEAAKALGVTADDAERLAAEAAKAQSQLEGVKEELADLQKKQDELAGKDAGVAAYRDNAKVIKAEEAEIASLQARFQEAGGSASDLAEKIEEPKQGLMKFAEEAKKVGGPIGALGGLIEKIGPKAGPLALVALIVAIGIAAAKATVQLVKFAMASADMARNALRARQSAAFGSMAGTKEIEGAMAALRENTAASKEEAQALASELYRLGDRGKQLEETALTIERFGQLGEDAKGAVKGLYEELRKPTAVVGVEGGIAKSMVVTKDMLPRDVFLELANKLGQDARAKLGQGFIASTDDIRAALARIGEQRFAGPALDQMRSLDKLSERLRENLQSLFEKLQIGVLLGALQKLVAILDETSESGKAIRDVLGRFAQPFADAVEAALPYLTAFFKGIIFGALIVALIAIKVKNALSNLIPTSLTKNIDWLKVAFFAAAVVVVGLAAAFTLLAAAGFLMALPFLTLVGLVALFIAGLLMAIDTVTGWADEVSEAFDGQDWATVAKSIIDGIIGGLADNAAALFNAFTDLAKGGYKAFKAAIISNSPSKLFRMAGRTIPEGTALGVEDGTPEVQGAVAAMASPADMGTAGGGGRRGGGGSINFVVQAGAVVIHVQSADEIEDEGFIRGLGRALVAAAREGGLSPEPEPT